MSYLDTSSNYLFNMKNSTDMSKNVTYSNSGTATNTTDELTNIATNIYKPEISDDNKKIIQLAYQLAIRVAYVLSGIVVLGSIGLYTCRIAQANLMPYNTDKQPYGTDNLSVQNIKINAITKGGMFSEPSSIKVDIDADKTVRSYENGILGFINSFKTNPKRAGSFVLYIRDIILNTVSIDNLILSNMFNFLNSYVNENIILLAFPSLFMVFFIILFVMNIILTMVFQLYYLPDLFRSPNKSGDKVVWGDVWLTFNFYGWLKLLALLFLGLGPIIGIGSIIFSTLYSILAPLTISGKVSATGERFNFMTFMIHIIKYKIELIMFIISIYMIIDAYKMFGTNSAIAFLVGAFITMLCVHFLNKKLSINDSTMTSGLVSYDQANML